ncbi:homeobox domain protein [Rhizoctonia solani]|uniref:Homeobox domain protein n=1 Tax=Rhizoctonia solani TaxID=456999 RepID=A0A8H8P579_9AGAM|nr:homeobox domain protein [Rhizoctonia solani]QRW24705.1 homeobox domain protein [Rhizoctonia solani]
MEQSQPARRSRRQLDHRNTARADGLDEEEIGDNGETPASSELVNQPDEMIDTPTDTQSKPRLNTGRTNKSRTVFTPEQLALLQDAFEKNPYPSREVREKLEEVTGLTPSLSTARTSPPTYSHSRSTSPSSDARPQSPRRRAHSSALLPPTGASYIGPFLPCLLGPACQSFRGTPHRGYYPEDYHTSAPISHTSGIPFPSASKHGYSLDSYASRRDMITQSSTPPSSAPTLPPVRSRPSLEWACAIERQRVRPYPKKPASRETGWSRHGNPSLDGTRSRSHSYSAAHGSSSGRKDEEDGGGSETEPEDDDVHEVFTPPQSLLALERQALVQSFGSAISASSSTNKFTSETQADLDAAMILVGMGKS